MEALLSKKGRTGALYMPFPSSSRLGRRANEERKHLSPLLTYFGGARLVESMERC